MKGFCTAREEWLFPDQELSELPESMELHMAQNGKEALRLLLPLESGSLSLSLEGADEFDAEWFEMIDVGVGYNETEKEEQDGMFVITEKDYEKPDYCTRKAPFRVYEALRPLHSLSMEPRGGRCALYLTLSPKPGTAPGTRKLTLHAGEYSLALTVRVYGVTIPEETLNVTNWFNLDNIALFHGIEMNTPAYFDMLRKYARAMRRTRQTHFFISFDPKKALVSKNPYRFDFSYLKPIIAIFFEEGFRTMEFGNFGTKHDNLFTDEIKCAADPSVPLSSDEGYYLTLAMAQSLASFLGENGWRDKTIFHIFDEPDVHISSPESMEKRKQQYLRVVSILRRYFPGCRTIEAVKTTQFKGAVDIWVPLTANYEEFREEYDKMSALGDEIWCYVCCVPTGRWLNRFLDIDLLRSRLLFWGCSRFGLKGYLHWGFNYWPQKDFDPFEESNAPNEPFNGIYPAGDAYIVYPGGEDGPWLGNRLEAQRRGAEDFELLALLKEKSPDAYEKVMQKTFRTNTDYELSAEHFEETRREILALLEAC